MKGSYSTVWHPLRAGGLHERLVDKIPYFAVGRYLILRLAGPPSEDATRRGWGALTASITKLLGGS